MAPLVAVYQGEKGPHLVGPAVREPGEEALPVHTGPTPGRDPQVAA